MCDPSFIDEAIRRASNAGFLPALGQRPVDWNEVALWARRASQPGVRWLDADEHDPYSGGDIIITDDGVICSGQHRILGGLMAGNPVPERSISRLHGPIPIPSQPWR